MKNIKKLTIASCAALLMTGCVDLTQEPRSFLTPGTIVYDEATIEVTANGLYKDLWYNNYGYNCRSMILQTGADDVIVGTITKRYKQIDELEVTSGLHDSDVEIMWLNLYTVIRTANSMLKDMAASKDTKDEVKAPFLGEAHFMRAYAYFNLVRYFGDVIATTDPTCTEAIAGYKMTDRVPVDVIYKEIIVPDLKKAEELLPERARTNDNSRPSKGAAKACLADVYLTMAGWPLNLGTEYYQLAADKAKEIIDGKQVKGYDLVKPYSDLWKEAKKADDTEHIFALNHDANNGTASNYGRSYYAAEESSAAWADYLGDSLFYEKTPADERKSFNYVTNFTVAGSPRPISFKKTSMRAPAINKYRDYTPTNSEGKLVMTAQTNGITPIYRYAEVLLMYAEASVKATNTIDATAKSCLEKVRNRAGGASATKATPTDPQQFLQEVSDEYGWEFFAEFKRWFQLVRTQQVVSANEANSCPRVQAAVKEAEAVYQSDPKSVCWFPLPQNEVNISNLVQNNRWR